MTPLDRLRLEKAAADCGFEMTPLETAGGIVMRSARFPETVLVSAVGGDSFQLSASDAAILPSPGGAASLTVHGFNDLYAILRSIGANARTRPNRVADEFRRKTASFPKGTEAERLVVQRVGQGLFRGALLDYWQGRCCVTGLDIPELLRASHIRPWALCETDEQRLDVFNGLLLAPHLDALFDAGLMTVEDSGEVHLGAAITMERQQSMGLVEAMTVHGLRAEHREYLRFHRSQVWRG
ncbi:HNH endonuclease [Roseateles sp. BYS78W]|uniref:HNH endonuclease n=1 Tax=Pelomonas candidula TaxID=3299025 RepID=A0ABW7HKS2_9BURK